MSYGLVAGFVRVTSLHFPEYPPTDPALLAPACAGYGAVNGSPSRAMPWAGSTRGTRCTLSR